ncbi:serine hydrolase domain-containing protein [candidate division KSB1 bacterium]
MKLGKYFNMSLTLFSVILIFLALGITQAEAFQAYTHTALTDSVDKLFADWDNDNTPGAALGIFQDGRIIYARGYGMANLEYNIPITPQTVFRIGSTSKQFTAMCIAILAEQGKLSLDDNIRKHIPEMQELDTPFTVRHLVHHISGVRDYLTLMGLVTRSDYYTSQDALAMLARQKGLDFPPGDRYSYANSGYFLLAEIVSRASGMKTSEFAKQYIFDPLGMNDTHFHDDLNVIVKNRASGYSAIRAGGFRINMTQLDIIGDGSIYTTIEDFFKWDQNFYHNVLSNGTQSLIDMALTRGRLNDGNEISYAFGLNVGTLRGLRRISHSGSWVGFRSTYMQFPDQRFSIVVFTNNALGPGSMAQKIAELYLADQFTEQPPPRQERQQRQQRTPQVQPEPVTLSSSQLQEYVGIYYSDELDTYATLSMEKDNPVMKLGSTTGTLIPYSTDNFRFGRRQIEFTRDPNNKTTGFVFQAGSALRLDFTKIN